MDASLLSDTLSKARRTSSWQFLVSSELFQASEEHVLLLENNIANVIMPYLPALLCLIWFCFDPTWSANIKNDKLAKFLVAMLLVLGVLQVIYKYASILGMQGKSFQRVVNSHAVPAAVADCRIQRQWNLGIGRVGAGFSVCTVLVLLRNWQGVVLAVCLLLSLLAVNVRFSLAVHSYAEQMVSDVHKQIMDFEPENNRPKSQPLDHGKCHFGETWELFHKLTLDLDGLYQDALPQHVALVMYKAVASVGCALLSFTLVGMDDIVFVMAPAGLSLLAALYLLKNLKEFSQITESCISTTPHGLLGALFEKGCHLDLMSEGDCRFYNALKDEFKFKQIGAKVGVTVDSRLIARAAATGSAAFVTLFTSLAQNLQVIAPTELNMTAT